MIKTLFLTNDYTNNKIYDKYITDYIFEVCQSANISKFYIVSLLKNECLSSNSDVTLLSMDFKNLQKFINADGYILIINDNIPLISSKTIKSIISSIKINDYDCIILKNRNKNIIYCVKEKTVLDILKNTNINNYEVFLNYLSNKISKKTYYEVVNKKEIYRTNTAFEIAKATKIILDNTRKKHMKNGVIMIDPNNTYIGIDVKIGKNTIIYPNTYLEGYSVIGTNSIIGPNTHIISTQIGNNVKIDSSIIIESKICDNSVIGPYSHIRANSIIDSNVKIGSFVETKNVVVGQNTKIPHLIYVGDANIGKNVEIACGVITANMNTNWKKNKTIIEDGAFIGCNSTLIAPVVIGKNSIVGAGSTITKDVLDNSLAIARSKQTNIEDWKKSK